MRNLRTIAALSFQYLAPLYGYHGPIILGGYSKRYWTKPKSGHRYSSDAKHRKAINGNRANVRRIQVLRRVGKTVYISRRNGGYW